MQKIKMSLISFLMLLMGTFGVHSTLKAEIENIDLNDYLKNKLQKYEAQISKDLFGNDYYKISSVKFKGDLNADYKLVNAELPLVDLMTTTQCTSNRGDTDITKEFDFSLTEQESYEATTSKTFTNSQSVKVGVQIKYKIINVGVSSKFKWEQETSNSETKGKLKSQTWTDKTTYTVRPGLKSTAQFIIQGSKIDEAPYTGHLNVEGAIEVTMKVPGRVYMYENMHYNNDDDGWRQYFHAGDNVSFWKKFNDEMSSVKVDKGLSITVYEDSNYRGTHHTYTSDVAFVGNFNDKLSSFKVGGKETKTIEIEKYLSEKERDIYIEGKLSIGQGVQSIVSVTDEPLDPKGTESSGKIIKLEDTKRIPGGKIISTKLRK